MLGAGPYGPLRVLSGSGLPNQTVILKCRCRALYRVYSRVSGCVGSDSSGSEPHSHTAAARRLQCSVMTTPSSRWPAWCTQGCQGCAQGCPHVWVPRGTNPLLDPIGPLMDPIGPLLDPIGPLLDSIGPLCILYPAGSMPGVYTQNERFLQP